LIRYFEDDSVVLYDLSRDPGEGTDLAAEQPERRDQLRSELDRWLRDTGAPIPRELNPRFQAPKRASRAVP
jgi:hypothetical protein